MESMKRSMKNVTQTGAPSSLYNVCDKLHIRSSNHQHVIVRIITMPWNFIGAHFSGDVDAEANRQRMRNMDASHLVKNGIIGLCELHYINQNIIDNIFS